MHTIYRKEKYNGKIRMEARAFLLPSGKYAIDTSINGKMFTINVNFPMFNSKEAAEDFLVKDGFAKAN